MKAQIAVVLVSVVSLALAVPVPTDDSRKELVKRGIFDSITHFPFLASSSSAHGSSSSSSSSSSEHDHEHEFHSHVIHHPELHEFDGHHEDFLHDHNFATSYQNQYFGHSSHDFPSHSSHEFPSHSSHEFPSHSSLEFPSHSSHEFPSHSSHEFPSHSSHEFPSHSSHEFPTSYHEQHLFDDQSSDFNKYDDKHDSLLDFSHLDAPEHIDGKFSQLNTHVDGDQSDDYKNYGGDLGQYSNIHAGHLDISDDRKIDNLLDPFYPNHSSYDSY